MDGMITAAQVIRAYNLAVDRMLKLRADRPGLSLPIFLDRVGACYEAVADARNLAARWLEQVNAHAIKSAERDKGEGA